MDDLGNVPSSTTGSTSSEYDLGPGYRLVTTFTTGGTGGNSGTGAPSPAPEPESWVLALAGFGAMGARLRTRRDPGLAGRVILRFHIATHCPPAVKGILQAAARHPQGAVTTRTAAA